MSQFLRHFTVVGDDYQSWNINYKKWENEEDDDDEGEQEQPQPAPAPGQEGREGRDAEAASVPPPRPPPDFRAKLRKLFSSHRFQVGGRGQGGRVAPVCVTVTVLHRRSELP